MKNILIATVGEEIKPVLEGFRYVKEIDEIYLLCSEKTKNFAEEISKKVKEIYGNVKIIESSANNISKILEDLINNVEISPGTKVIGNITGGTKIMILALYLFVSVCKGTVFYIFKKTDKEMEYVELPVVNVLSTNIIKGTKKKIISILFNDIPLTQREISKCLNFKDSTTKLHLEKMKEEGIIKTNYKGKMKIVMLTPYGKVLFLLKQIEEKIKISH